MQAAASVSIPWCSRLLLLLLLRIVTIQRIEFWHDPKSDCFCMLTVGAGAPPFLQSVVVLVPVSLPLVPLLLLLFARVACLIAYLNCTWLMPFVLADFCRQDFGHNPAYT